MICRILLTFAAWAAMISMMTKADTEVSDHQPLVKVNHLASIPLKLNITNYPQKVRVGLVFDKNLVFKSGGDRFRIYFGIKNLAPQFEIFKFSRPTGHVIEVSRASLEFSGYTYPSSFEIDTIYIGRAVILPYMIEYSGRGINFTIDIGENSSLGLPISLVRADENSTWSVIFIVSVTILVIISYINLGAQLDLENLRETIEKPQVLVKGFFISVFVMPIISWTVGKFAYGHYSIYRVGSFIFACCPAASASTLWTVMFNSDKELSVSLQAASSIGSLITMPGLLYLMDKALQLEGIQYAIKVPYGRIIGTQAVLALAILAGWYFVGRHERARKISSRIFKPLTFFMLFFIIGFSLIVYWYIYVMFDIRISMTSLLITLSTYGLTILLGYLASDYNLDLAIAISISSTYKNSGICFAVLLVAFESPDTLIGYVPCLTQVLTTSVVLYLTYYTFALVNYIRRRNQPNPIQATDPDAGQQETQVKQRISSDSGRSIKGEEKDEFIAMNVTDVVAGSS